MFDGHARFADNGSHFTYRFDIPAGVTGGTLSLDIGNEYLVRVSSDDQNWRTVLRRRPRSTTSTTEPSATSTSTTCREQPDALRARRGCQPDDGWGGWLAHLKLAFNGA